ncbi:putative fluoride ion transporter CrcB [Streptomyces sp. ADI96-02]|uniref:fluoride efflux transporter FluC n=1 Tax=unclassified Streptomyces TaxID=2593676 RepID=UPI000F554266|nr:CrcB family protein [Streptomyces sp. ADI96-02]RPK55158.1 putative fluoride ion transporter CrcB [Streptomyces sp. ADI96-02]
MESRRPGPANGPIDPDVDLSEPAQRSERANVLWPVVAVVALGGATGTAARYGATLLWPTAAGRFPWTVLLVNAVGCAMIGVFMVVLSDRWAAHRLVRPFFGTGVLGGFTTFSTYTGDIRALLNSGRAGTALAYLALTALTSLAAVWAAVWATRRVRAGRRT